MSDENPELTDYDWYVRNTPQRVFDRHGQLVKKFPPLTIRAARYIQPFSLNLRHSTFEPWRREGGRVEFEPKQGGVVWWETERKYETWFHNPCTGEVWGRKPVAEFDPNEPIDWSRQ